MPDMYIMCMRVRRLTYDVHIKYKQKEALNSAVRGFSLYMFHNRCGVPGYSDCFCLVV